MTLETGSIFLLVAFIAGLITGVRLAKPVIKER